MSNSGAYFSLTLTISVIRNDVKYANIHLLMEIRSTLQTDYLPDVDSQQH